MKKKLQAAQPIASHKVTVMRFCAFYENQFFIICIDFAFIKTTQFFNIAGI